MMGMIKTVQLCLYCSRLKNHPSPEEDNDVSVAMVNKLISESNFREIKWYIFLQILIF